MAVYHFTIKHISRAKGRTATAAAAYRSASKIHDNRTGQLHDYTRKRGVLSSEIIAPSRAPAWARDKEKLWNAAELMEKRHDSRVARENIVALPHELSLEENKSWLHKFVEETYVKRGMVAQVDIHAPNHDGDQRNYHAHILLTGRQVTRNGFKAIKPRKWNDKDVLVEWREEYANHMNQALEKANVDERVDHRSYEDRGMDRMPTQHLGPAANQIEREGKSSRIGDENRLARDFNNNMEVLEKEGRSLEALIEQEIARQKTVDEIRNNMEDAVQKRQATVDELKDQISQPLNKEKPMDNDRGQDPPEEPPSPPPLPEAGNDFQEAAKDIPQKDKSADHVPGNDVDAIAAKEKRDAALDDMKTNVREAHEQQARQRKEEREKILQEMKAKVEKTPEYKPFQKSRSGPCPFSPEVIKKDRSWWDYRDSKEAELEATLKETYKRRETEDELKEVNEALESPESLKTRLFGQKQKLQEQKAALEADLENIKHREDEMRGKLEKELAEEENRRFPEKFVEQPKPEPKPKRDFKKVSPPTPELKEKLPPPRAKPDLAGEFKNSNTDEEQKLSAAFEETQPKPDLDKDKDNSPPPPSAIDKFNENAQDAGTEQEQAETDRKRRLDDALKQMRERSQDQNRDRGDDYEL